MVDLSRNYPAKHAVHLMAVGILMGIAVIIDDLLIEQMAWIDIIYALPILAAAFLLSPLEVAAVGLLAMMLCYSAQVFEGTPLHWWTSALVGLSGVIVAIMAALARRWHLRERTARDALAASPLAYAAFHFPGYTLTTFNKTFQEMVSAADQGEIAGRRLLEIMPTDAADKLSILMDQAVAERKQANRRELHLITGSGRGKYWNITAIPLEPRRHRNPRSVTIIGLDVTESVHRSRSRDAALKISEAVMSSLDLDRTVRVVLESLAYVAGTDAGALFLLEDDQWIGVAGAGEYSDDQVRSLRLPYDDLKSGAEAVAMKQALAMEDVVEDNRFTAELIRKFNIRSSLVIPLVTGKKTVGLAWLNQTDRRRDFSDDQVEFATNVGAQAALAIDNASVYETEHTMRKSLEAIEMVSEAGLASLDLEEVLMELVNRTQDVMQMEAAVILLADEDGEYLESRAAAGSIASSSKRYRIKVGEGLVGRAYREGVPMKIDDISNLEAEMCPFADSAGVKSVLAVPLRLSGRTQGILQIGSQRVHAFSAREWGLIQVLADRASMAVQNSILFDETRKELARAELLRDVAAACAGNRDIREIASRALETIYNKLECDMASIYALTTDGRQLLNLATIGHPQEAMAELQQVSLDRETLLTRAVREGKTLTHEDSGRLSDSQRFILGALGLDEDNRRLALPIIYKQEKVGGMALAFRDKRRFTRAELQTLEGTADQLAVAISLAGREQFESRELDATD